MSDKAHIKAKTGDAPELNTPTKRIKTAIALLANEGFSGFIEALINKIFISYFRFSSIKRFTLKTLHQEKTHPKTLKPQSANIKNVRITFETTVNSNL